MNKKQITILSVLGLLALAVLIISYSNHWQNSFHFDDAHTINTNVYIRDIHNIPSFFKSSETFSSLPANQAYRPLVTTSLAIDYWLNGKFDPQHPFNTFYYHLSTFIWYVFQCVLLFFIFLKIFNLAKKHDWNPYLALFAASLYSVHTANAETVNYIISRSDTLSTFAVILSMFLYLYSPFCKRTYLYAIPFLLGIFIKETSAMFPFLLLVYIYLFETKATDSLAIKAINSLKKIVLPLLLAIFLIVFVLSHISSNWEPGGINRFDYLKTETFVMVHYFNTFFFPFNLSADTDWKAITNIFDDRVLIGTAFILALLFIAFKCSKNQTTKPISFGILFFFLALAPTSSLMPFAEVMNDHRIFFPFIGLMMSVVWSIGLLIIKKEQKLNENPIYKYAIIAFSFLVISAHAYGTYQRNIVWHTDESLWLDVTIKSPGNGRGLMNYGLSQMSQAKYEVALDYFNRALVLNPYYAYLHTNLGVIKGALGQYEEAETYFKNSLLYGPKYPECYYYYAVFLNGRNRTAEAIQLLQTALTLSPGHVLSKTLLDQINSNPALANSKSPLLAAEELVKTTPTADNFLNLSLQYYSVKRYDDCIKACRECIKLKPDYPQAFNNICSAYNELGKYDSAIIACNQALLLQPNFERASNNLKEAKRRKGK
ncbi:MAG: tetratricopeptide repeat protein [Bacteroidota bacterium]